MLRYILSLSCCLLCIISAAYAQVGIGTATPNPKAILELNTTDKGLLPPRLTTAQRNSIGAAAAEDGMIVFDTDLDSLMIYQAAANAWHSIAFTTIGSTAWNLNGNAATNPATHYIGTSDAQSLVIKTAGTERMRISAAGNIGIGTPTPSATLHITSNASPAFRLVDGTEGAGKVLVSDANGNASWQTPAANLTWNLTGNALTNPATHYIGTSDAQSLRFKVNNQFSGLIEYAAADGNTAFGYKTMANPTASGALRNVAFGDGVLGALTNGDDNTGIGYRALENNTTGSQNVAAGFGTLRNNTTGVFNTATGNQALFFNTGGSFNTATGARALINNTTGNHNVATGFNALYFNNIGSSNVATGRNALYANTAGWQNTALGDSAGYTNSTGMRNTYLGYRADANANNYDNSTAIGHQAVVRASNSMMFGNTGVTNWSFGRSSAPTAGRALEVGTGPANGNGAYLTSGGNWTNTSDRNLKTNITNLSGAEILAKIGQLPVTRWTYKGTNETHIGPMAQDFYRLFNVGLDSVSISTVDPGGVALIGIQELKRQVESLNAENNALKKEIERQQVTFNLENSALKKEIEDLRRENVAQQAAIAKIKDLEAAVKALQDRAGIKAEK